AELAGDRQLGAGLVVPDRGAAGPQGAIANCDIRRPLGPYGSLTAVEMAGVDENGRRPARPPGEGPGRPDQDRRPVPLGPGRPIDAAERASAEVQLGVLTADRGSRLTRGLRVPLEHEALDDDPPADELKERGLAALPGIGILSGLQDRADS